MDRVGKRRVLLVSSAAIACFSLIYAVLPSYPLMLGLVIVHGCFWSGLLVAAASYLGRNRHAVARCHYNAAAGSIPGRAILLAHEGAPAV